MSERPHSGDPSAPPDLPRGVVRYAVAVTVGRPDDAPPARLAETPASAMHGARFAPPANDPPKEPA